MEILNKVRVVINNEDELFTAKEILKKYKQKICNDYCFSICDGRNQLLFDEEGKEWIISGYEDRSLKSISLKKLEKTLIQLLKIKKQIEQ